MAHLEHPAEEMIHLFSVSLLLAICAAGHAAQAEWKAQIELALAHADKAEIYFTGEHLDEQGAPVDPKPLGTIERAGIGSDFCRLWAIDEQSSGWACLCDGDLYVDFSRDGKKLLRLRYHHGVGFAWEGGPWNGIATIAKKDRENVLRWFNRHGANSLKLHVSEQEPNRITTDNL